ncbi:MAG: DUF502 domain-containing protein [Chitinivibrionales bacterium]|nr:DUF502 domain-containing protein [Chitinivibrionales bacterium]MBD3357258.1 DUF502 domain-containing protein [Chitinivibrionales bacterium]
MSFATIRQIRTNVVAGVLLLIPLVTTLYVFFRLFTLVDSILPSFFHVILPFMPEEWVPGVGALLVVVIAYFVGLGAKNYVGRVVIDTGNAIISSIPMLNKLYLGVQQVLDAVVSGNKRLFEKAVLIEYPKKDSYCVAFVTSKTMGEIQRKTASDVVSVFVPTTPNPTSGFLLFLPESQIIELDMSVETAVKTVMSAGMVNPDQLKRTNHRYAIPHQLKKWNWLRIFRGGNRDDIIASDPRD